MQFREWLNEGIYRNKRNCPYWGDAGSGVTPLAKSTGRLLVAHRGIASNEGGTYGVFGGGIFLDEAGFEDVDELSKTDYPKKHALQELKEETGYSGPMNLVEVFIYKDNKTNTQGQPCHFYYWNYIGICPDEFPVKPGEGYEWEEGGGSKWVTFDELMSIQPKHFGLESLLKNAGGKILGMVRKIGQ